LAENPTSQADAEKGFLDAATDWLKEKTGYGDNASAQAAAAAASQKQTSQEESSAKRINDATTRNVVASRTIATQAAGLAYDTVDGVVKIYNDAITLANDENANVLQSILERYGGNVTKAYLIQGAELGDFNEGLAKQQIKIFNDTHRMFSETDLGGYFADIATMQRSAIAMQDSLALTTYNAAAEMTAETTENALRFQETMGYTSREVAGLLRRGYLVSGETSDKILHDITLHAGEVSKATGIPMKALSDDIKVVMMDMDAFTDMTVEGAARMTASLKQMGVSIQGFKGMMEPFRDFDTAASKMGDLSAIFGVQMDAMEMMYLASEEPEEFLHKMRDQLIDQGIDMENMSKTRQRALAATLGMGIEEAKTFMMTGERMTSQQDLMAASAEANAKTQGDAIDSLKDQAIPKTFSAAEIVNRKLGVQLSKNARHTLKMKNNMAGMVRQIEDATEKSENYQAMMAADSAIRKEMADKTLTAADAAALANQGGTSSAQSELAAQQQAAEKSRKSSATGLPTDESTEGAAEVEKSLYDQGVNWAKSTWQGFRDRTKVEAGASSTPKYSREIIEPGWVEIDKEAAVSGAKIGTSFATSLAGNPEKYKIMSNPFQQIEDGAKEAGKRTGDKFAGSMYETQQKAMTKVQTLQKKATTTLQKAWESSSAFIMGDDAKPKTYGDASKQHISPKSVAKPIADLDTEKVVEKIGAVSQKAELKSDQLTRVIKAAIIQGFNSIDNIGYDGDITLTMDGVKLIKSLPATELTKLIINTPISLDGAVRTVATEETGT
jgi:hypothetical protein